MNKDSIIPDFIVVDGHNLAYKQFHALHQFSSADGKPIGVIMGMTRSMVAFQKAFPNTHIITCFDNQGIKNKREFCPEYKTNRVTRNHAFYAQLNVMKGMLPMLGISTVSLVGYEADQLVASYVKQLPGKKLIISDDKDLAQCVSKDVRLYQRPGKKWVQVDENDVLQKYGVQPKDINTLLALSGDKVDCIPGIHGIGPAYARELINRFGNIHNIFRSEEVKTDPRFNSVLTEENYNKAQNYLKLTTLPGDVTIPHLSKPISDPDSAMHILNHYGLKLAGASLKSLFPDHNFQPLPDEKKAQVNKIIRDEIYMLTSEEPPTPNDAWRRLER